MVEDHGLAPERSEPKFVWVGVLDTRELVCAVSMQEKRRQLSGPRVILGSEWLGRDAE